MWFLSNLWRSSKSHHFGAQTYLAQWKEYPPVSRPWNYNLHEIPKVNIRVRWVYKAKSGQGDLQWTMIGPSWPNCSLVLCTWPMSSMKPSPCSGTLCSGQSVNWNCRTVRHWPSCVAYITRHYSLIFPLLLVLIQKNTWLPHKEGIVQRWLQVRAHTILYDTKLTRSVRTHTSECEWASIFNGTSTH